MGSISSLQADRVQIWQIDLDRPIHPIEELYASLSSDEQARGDRFRFERDRHKFIVARGMLRSLLGQHLAVAPEMLEFVYGDRGKPTLVNPHPEGTLHFNVSHSQGMALVAIALNRRVGIDLEYLRPIDADSLAQRFFSPQEAAIIQTLPAPAKQQLFFRAWTQKEAYLKATGEGLGKLENVVVDLQGEPFRFLALGGDAIENWTVQEVTVS
ncbi:MAG: 4'-phosphopantetheinyl transferase superfamily protein, partial [Oculatellaceae cyanobacterium Prado106]|nr:4'-phosphopantetheinyl transferase superfamily protein [Oculatellaceae cyanobacterium Prado106]